MTVVLFRKSLGLETVYDSGLLIFDNASDTVDGRNPAPPQKAWNHGCHFNINEQWIPMISMWCNSSSIRSINIRLGTSRCEPGMAGLLCVVPHDQLFCTNYMKLTYGLFLPHIPFYPFLGEGSPTKIDYRNNKKVPGRNTSLMRRR